MTREEEIITACKGFLAAYPNIDQAGLSIGFLDGAVWSDKHPKNQWISVDEDLPCNHEEFIETGGHYLKETIYVITVNKYGIIEGNYMILYDDGKWEWKYGATPCYWMLIPKLPKEIEIELAIK